MSCLNVTCNFSKEKLMSNSILYYLCWHYLLKLSFCCCYFQTFKDLIFPYFPTPFFGAGCKSIKLFFIYLIYFKTFCFFFCFISLDNLTVFFLRSAKVGMYISVAKLFKSIMKLFFKNNWKYQIPIGCNPTISTSSKN